MAAAGHEWPRITGRGARSLSFFAPSQFVESSENKIVEPAGEDGPCWAGGYAPLPAPPFSPQMERTPAKQAHGVRRRLNLDLPGMPTNNGQHDDGGILLGAYNHSSHLAAARPCRRGFAIPLAFRGLRREFRGTFQL